MNNMEKLDSIRRTLRRIDTQLGIIQRTNVIMFERITGRAFPHSWVVHDDEQAILSQDESAAYDQLTERITQIEKLLAGEDKTISIYREN